MKTMISVSTLLLISNQALAHSGHDHSHWLAQPVHAITALAITAVLGTASYFLRERAKSRTNNL